MIEHYHYKSFFGFFNDNTLHKNVRKCAQDDHKCLQIFLITENKTYNTERRWCNRHALHNVLRYTRVSFYITIRIIFGKVYSDFDSY